MKHYLIRLNIVLYFSLSLNACDCLICHIYQYNCNRLKNHTHFTFQRCVSLLSSTKSIRYTSEKILSWKVNIYIVSFKFKGFFSINIQITIISIIMQKCQKSKQNFVFGFVKLTLNIFPGDPKLPLIP